MFEVCVATGAIPICGYNENLAQDITKDHVEICSPLVARVYADDPSQYCHQGPHGFPVSGSQPVTMLVSKGCDATGPRLSTGDMVSS